MWQGEYFAPVFVVLGSAEPEINLGFSLKFTSPCVAVLYGFAFKSPNLRIYSAQVHHKAKEQLVLMSEALRHPDLQSCPSHACSPLPGPWFPNTDGCPDFGLLAAQ